MRSGHRAHVTAAQIGSWIAGAKSGQPDAFDLLIDHYADRVFGYLIRMTGSRADAEDLLRGGLAARVERPAAKRRRLSSLKLHELGDIHNPFLSASLSIGISTYDQISGCCVFDS